MDWPLTPECCFGCCSFAELLELLNSPRDVDKILHHVRRKGPGEWTALAVGVFVGVRSRLCVCCCVLSLACVCVCVCVCYSIGDNGN